MYHLIKQPEEQLRILFRNTAQKTGLHEAIVEKDFWVCLTLDYLFHSTTSSNWSGDNGAIKVHSKTTTQASIVVGGSFNTSRNVDWLAIGT